MKKFFLLIILFFSFSSLWPNDIVNEYKSIIKEINKKMPSIWGIKFYPNIIFIDTQRNKMYIIDDVINDSNYTVQKWDNKILPANSCLSYSDKKYITIIYDSYCRLDFLDKIALIAHESYHYYQEEIGYKMVSSNNTYLDNGEGRILLRCELNALEKALKNDTNALKDALLIRVYRQSLFNTNNEAEFELNEGLAEYTKLACICNSIEGLKEKLLLSIINNDSIGYTNNFAYMTGPIYAYFLNNKDFVRNHLSDITNELKRSYRVPIFFDKTEISPILTKYGYHEIAKQEKNKTDSIYKYYFKNKDYIYIRNNNTNISFNPNDRIIEVNDSLLLLSNIKLKSEWGIIEASNGLIRDKHWNFFLLPPPKSIIGNRVIGECYRMELTNSYNLIKVNNVWKIMKSKD